jgi:hypothetical protein
MKRATSFALACLLAIVAIPPAARADSFRCGVHLVDLGDSEESVVDRCGRPSKTVRTTPRKRGTIFDVWTYDLGPTQFVRILRFDATTDRLLDIVLGDYGT